MWVAKLSSNKEAGFLRGYAIQYNILMTGYPISSHQSGKFLYTTVAGTLYGKEQNKMKCMFELSREKAILSFEYKNDFFIMTYKEPLDVVGLYSSHIIYLKPIILFPTGEYVLEVGSLKKENIEKFIKLLEKERKMKLLKFTQQKIGSISIIGVLPELTMKQKIALELSIKSGYYHYPRKIDLNQLSKLMHVSLSTFRQHLRVAEKKIMLNVLKDIAR